MAEQHRLDTQRKNTKIRAGTPRESCRSASMGEYSALPGSSVDGDTEKDEIAKRGHEMLVENVCCS